MFLRLFILPMLVLSFTSADKDFKKGEYVSCEQSLLTMLDQAASGHEKAEVLWRLSRVSHQQGEEAGDKETKRLFFGRGIEYAEQAMEEEPDNFQCYLWHSANVGRDCQTRGLANQAKAATKVQRDFSIILDKLGRTDCSAAWRGLGEYFYQHPFKSKEQGINYARRSVVAIPDDEPGISNCLVLADMLYERNWSEEKREKAAHENSAKFRNGSLKNSERYAFYDGSDEQMPWLEEDLDDYTDREEAQALVRYARARYEACKDPSAIDRKEYKLLQTWINTHH